MSDPTKEALQALFLAFPAQERTDNERELVKVYLIAIDGIPSGFVAMACRRYIGGQVPNAGMTFRPTPAEVASEARRLHDAAKETQRIAQLPGPRERPRLTGPKPKFTPYPKLWEALAGSPDLVKALEGMTFDGMTQMSKLFATEGLDAVKAKLTQVAAAPNRERAA